MKSEDPQMQIFEDLDWWGAPRCGQAPGSIRERMAASILRSRSVPRTRLVKPQVDPSNLHHHPRSDKALTKLIAQTLAQRSGHQSRPATWNMIMGLKAIIGRENDSNSGRS